MGKLPTKKNYSNLENRLTFSSGGVRGITQLVMLQRLERELGGKIPIQSFFDLTVGTRCVYEPLSALDMAQHRKCGWSNRLGVVLLWLENE